MKVTITIDTIKIFKIYLIGIILAYFVGIFLYNRERKKTVFINSQILVISLLGWISVIYFIICVFKKYDKALSKTYWWLRFKDIIRLRPKENTLYHYSNNKYFRKIEEKITIKKLVYRISKNEIRLDYYPKKSFESYIKIITLENFKECFDYYEIDNLKTNYILLVLGRFCRLYK
jgi:hypothetical protein